MKKIIILTILLAQLTFISAQKMEENFDFTDKIEQLIGQLSLEEKASICSGRDDWSTQPVERLDIPWIWLADGPHGVRRAPATNRPGYGDQLPATCFPTASALAATWDLDLIQKVGEALGRECQALDVNVLLGPGVNIKRSVLGGRNFEYYSEDPYLAGEMGAAFINGVQSQGVGTSLKHFTANNVETMRMYMNSDVDTRTLHEIYLKPFEIAVKKAQPWTVMACYNRVQGEYGTQNPYLLTTMLKEEWGYEGIVISDWFAIVDRVKAIQAGMHIEMPHVSDINDKKIVEAVKDGTLDEELVDDLVREILFIVFKAKALEKKDATFSVEDHHAFAREVLANAVTLLKNENNILPVTPGKYRKIAVIGEFAENPRYQGNGSSEVKPTKLDKPIDILKDEYGNSYEIKYARGYDLKDDDAFKLIDEAVELAQSSDIALVYAGLPLHYESEGIDRKHIDMPASHNKLIQAIADVQEKTVVVLTNGSAIAMPWIDQVDAILETWLGGQAGAGGVADVIFGKVNPSGKLAETFPVRLEDTPAFFNFPGEQGEVNYGERIFVGYRYYDEKKIKPLFPFGHGLSYTTFEYGELIPSSGSVLENEELILELKIKNTGDRTGKEVVQLYVTDLQSTLQRPEKELKRFKKITLEPGEEKKLVFNLNKDDFAYYDAQRKRWIAETGEFTISAGSSSGDLRSKTKVSYKATEAIPLCFDEYTFFSEYWKHDQTRELLKEYVPKWIGNFVPAGKSLDEAEFHGFLIEHPLIKYPYITNGELTDEKMKELVARSKAITFIP
jgi:beta-glucosidase